MFNAGQLKIPEVQTAYSAGSGGKFDNIDYVWGDKLDIGRVYTQWDPIKKEYREMELTSRGKNNFKNFLEFSMISNTTVSVSSSGNHDRSITTSGTIQRRGRSPFQHSDILNHILVEITKRLICRNAIHDDQRLLST